MKKNEANNIQYSRSAKIMKRIIWMLCILLVLSGAGLAIVSAAPQDDSPSLELYKNHAKDNEPFQVSNMVPGDKVSQDFTVRIHHKDQVTLYFKGLITKQSKDLGDVLQIPARSSVRAHSIRSIIKNTPRKSPSQAADRLM